MLPLFQAPIYKKLSTNASVIMYVIMGISPPNSEFSRWDNCLRLLGLYEVEGNRVYEIKTIATTSAVLKIIPFGAIDETSMDEKENKCDERGLRTML
jgi:hypothetical protein